MSNERIDLTQFENISSEGWEYLSDESRNINDAALDKIPDLIAELKRCYEELDRKNKLLEELDRCPTCGKEGVWFTADTDAEFDDECRRCGRDNKASE